MGGCIDANSRLDVTLQQLVEQVVTEHKDQIAVRFGDQELTYQQLSDRADRLAQTILVTNPDAEWIGVSTTRNLAMVVGVLAILKAGKAYLPLDPGYPDLRLQQIIADSGLKTCLAAEVDEPLFNRLGLRVIGPDQAPLYASPQPIVHQTSTAYVLYTSGSTGKPKGVCMGHGPLVNLLQWQEKHSKASIATRTLQLAPLSFDVSFQEIFATLTTGGTLVLVDETLRLDLNALLRFIDEQAINRLFLPFVALQYLAEMAVNTHCFPAGLQEVMTAGEQLKITPQIAAFFSALPQCLLFNQYGPTECHVVTQLTLSGNPASWPSLPTIGYPIDQVSVLVADEELKPLPDGETGELCFGGACLAEGYLNNPALTKEKFTELQLATGEPPMRVYRTGDLGRVLPDGSIEFLGRRDDQVKIRGHRVELGEVEVIISQLPAVSQAVVVAHRGNDGQQQLVAYIVPVEGTLPQADFRTQLDQKLPEYMMPSVFVWLDQLPKTSSGKVDKKRLPEPDRKRPALTVAYRKPRTESERAVARIWCKVLQMDEVGLDDNFFELGGNSLLAQKTVAALKEYQPALSVIKLYQYPTVATLAEYLTPPNGLRQGHSAQTVTQNQPEKGEYAAPNADVAIIGMAGRFPGASTVGELWDLLKAGKETTRFFTDSELDPSIPDKLKNDSLYVKARGVIDEVDQFDAHFFGLSPNVAQLMDPQQRVFLEIAWEALEQTGYLPTAVCRSGGRICRVRQQYVLPA